MPSNKHNRYHYQENSIDTGDTGNWYWYRRSVRTSKNNTVFGKWFKKRFQTLYNRQWNNQL